MTISLDTITFSDRIESQIDWVNRWDWQPIGQSIRYALQGNPVIMENPRSGQPITLVAEPPWCWLKASTLLSLHQLASEINRSFQFVWNEYSCLVRFRRDQGPLVFVPVNSLKNEYSGSIYLISV